MNHKKKDEPPPWYQLYDINIKSYNEDPETHQNNELKRLQDKKKLGKRAASPERRIPLPINPPIYSHDQHPNFSTDCYQTIKTDVQKIKEQNILINQNNNNLQNKNEISSDSDSDDDGTSTRKSGSQIKQAVDSDTSDSDDDRSQSASILTSRG